MGIGDEKLSMTNWAEWALDKLVSELGVCWARAFNMKNQNRPSLSNWFPTEIAFTCRQFIVYIRNRRFIKICTVLIQPVASYSPSFAHIAQSEFTIHEFIINNK